MEVDDERRSVRSWDEEVDDEGGGEGSARLAWERDYERTWEVVQEDATGALDTHSFLHSQQRLRRSSILSFFITSLFNLLFIIYFSYLIFNYLFILNSFFFVKGGEGAAGRRRRRGWAGGAARNAAARGPRGRPVAGHGRRPRHEALAPRRHPQNRRGAHAPHTRNRTHRTRTHRTHRTRVG